MEGEQFPSIDYCFGKADSYANEHDSKAYRGSILSDSRVPYGSLFARANGQKSSVRRFRCLLFHCRCSDPLLFGFRGRRISTQSPFNGKSKPFFSCFSGRVVSMKKKVGSFLNNPLLAAILFFLVSGLNFFSALRNPGDGMLSFVAALLFLAAGVRYLYRYLYG